ncbi:MAG TPA: hypothetical protein EYQ80_05535 [Candidatus Poseidoniales archaeon]|nr:hypothetical protein [Candidatus Poseidoniales archaeon]
MSGVLVDACGWIAVVDARINIDLALEQEVGPVELKVTAAVFGELDRVANRENRNLLLDLLRSRAEIVNGSGGHTDDELIELSVAQDWPVLTVDRRLKARLHAANASVIEVMSSRNLRLID